MHRAPLNGAPKQTVISMIVAVESKARVPGKVPIENVYLILTKNFGRSSSRTAITPINLYIFEHFYGHTNSRLGVKRNPAIGQNCTTVTYLEKSAAGFKSQVLSIQYGHIFRPTHFRLFKRNGLICGGLEPEKKPKSAHLWDG